MASTFKAGDKFREPDLEMVPASYLYSDGESFYFMDQESFDTVMLSGDMIGDASDFLAEGLIIQLHKYNGNPIGLQLPPHVEMTVTHTEPGVRGDTSSGSVTGNRPGNSRAALYQRGRKSECVHRDAGVRRAGMKGQFSPRRHGDTEKTKSWVLFEQKAYR